MNFLFLTFYFLILNSTHCLQLFQGWRQHRPNILWGGTKGRRDAKRWQMERGMMRTSVSGKQPPCCTIPSAVLDKGLYLPPDCAHVPSPWEILLRGGAWTGERSEHKWELSVYTDDYPDCSRRTNKQNTGRSQEPRVAGSPNGLVFCGPSHGVRKTPLVGQARDSWGCVQKWAVTF